MTAPEVKGDSELRHAKKPCADCPWRYDSPPDQFPAERFEALRCTSDQSGLTAPLFACHKSAEGKDIACAGWLAIEGHSHIGVRLAVITGRLDPAVLETQPGWPDLYPSYDFMLEAKGIWV